MRNTYERRVPRPVPQYTDVDPAKMDPLDGAPWLGHLPSPTKVGGKAMDQYQSREQLD
jgi:hypothetical protein